MVKPYKIFSLCIALCLAGTPIQGNTHHSKKHKHAAAPTSHHSKKHKSAGKSSAAATPYIPSNTPLAQGIDSILSSFPNTNVGVIVQSAETGATLYQHNASTVFMPASTLKLFTATAALTLLGPNYTFPTQFLADSNDPNNGTLPGNLYVKFSGDPQLSVQNLESLVATLANRGIHNVQGNLVIDDTAMDRVNWGPGWMWDEQNFCYAAPSNAIILNRNCFAFNLIPSKQYGGQAHVKVDPSFVSLSILNDVITKTAHTWECPLDLKATGSNSYSLTGCIGPSHAPMSVAVAINDTRQAGTEVVSNLLRQHHITISGDVVYERTPENSVVLAQHNSRPLKDLVHRMLKKSDNLIADSLFKKVGGTYYNTSGTWQNGAQAIKAILASRTGIDFSKANIVDGAGLSRYDLVSPQHFAKLLKFAYSMPASDEFYQALPASGIDGTLRGRLGGPTAGKVHAKTGTMESTSGLAGYIQAANDQHLIFAILINGFVGGKSKQGTYHLLEDRICQFLASHGGGSVAPVAPASPAADVVQAVTTASPVAK